MGATELVRWGAALLTCAIGLFLLDAFSRWILHTKREREQLNQRIRAGDSRRQASSGKSLARATT